MSVIVVDTETTGLYSFKHGPHDPCQPDIVQLAFMICDDGGKILSQFASLIKPEEHWKWSKDAEAVHGHTIEQCTANGLTMTTALRLMWHMSRDCHTIVAHNLQFDKNMIMTELHRTGQANPFVGKKEYCTKLHGTPVAKVPGSRGFKWPKLSELHTHFFGKPHEGAHDAMVDVVACRDCYFQLVKLNAPAPAEGSFDKDGYNG